MLLYVGFMCFRLVNFLFVHKFARTRKSTSLITHHCTSATFGTMGVGCGFAIVAAIMTWRETAVL